MSEQRRTIERMLYDIFEAHYTTEGEGDDPDLGLDNWYLGKYQLTSIADLLRYELHKAIERAKPNTLDPKIDKTLWDNGVDTYEANLKRELGL